jgi:UDP-N-acetylglucosamine transferase subunit ALG13
MDNHQAELGEHLASMQAVVSVRRAYCRSPVTAAGCDAGQELGAASSNERHSNRSCTSPVGKGGRESRLLLHVDLPDP